MSLCRYLPLPSDRMGIIWSLLAVEDSIVLEYGPAGTTHYSMGLYGGLGVDFEQRLFTTHLSEDDVVMGDVSRLEDTIVELDSFYHPRVIFVVASSVIAVIGTDIKGVCRYMQSEVKAKLVAFDQGGFRGDYSAGLEATYKLLVNNLVKPPEQKLPRHYNIIGLSMGNYRASSDVVAIQELMQKAFGMELSACLCYATNSESISKCSGAALNLVLRQEGQAAAEILQSKYAQPYVLGAPYGYKGTLEWLQKISELLPQEINKEVVKGIKEKIGSLMPMGPMMRRKAKPQTVLYGEYELVKGLGQFLEEQGFQILARLSKHSLKNITADAGIEYWPDEKKRIDFLKSLNYTLVLADDVSLRLCNNTNVTLRVSYPRLKGMNVATHLPFVGEKGADFIQETIEAYLQSLY